jgi:CheY-like chemotaxis protein
MQGAGIVQRNTQGEPERFIGVSIDITDRKRLESQLLHTIERLAVADRRKNEFLATLAHELRNPLAPISNGLQILKLVAPADERLRRTTEVMERQLSHLLRLVDDLLDVTRIARGKAQLRKEPLAINGVLARALESCAQLIEARQLELKVRMGTESLWVNGDSDRLMQVFSNLLSNAAKYTEEGGHIDVALEHSDGKVIVRVKDTGIGIPPESLDTVFELFSQLRPPAHGDGGLGIGLALVRQLVQRHGGTVEAHSGGCGQGSEFVVRLPATTAPPTASRSAPEQPAAPLLSTRRVLVVDDNTDAAESLKSLLTMLGHEVREAADGVQAIETACSFDPHVIFMDIDMPRLNGVDAARRIRELALAHQPVIVALTGLGQEADRERSRKAGIDYHIVKPIDRQSLDRIFGGTDNDLSSDRETRAGIRSSLSSESSIPAQSPGSPLLAQRID